MSEVIVLDTHIWLWLINANFDQFPSRWRDSIESATRVGISPMSCYEIALGICIEIKSQWDALAF
jgi:PIN domain nuclease of toxin-antitoxin system